jgi:SAM-dependent methyltransferase
LPLLFSQGAVIDTVNLTYFKNHFEKLGDIRKVLEIGSFNVNGNCKEFILDKGLSYLGIDLREGPDVDVIHDITDDRILLPFSWKYKFFDLIICMNVLEHIYNPIHALDNMFYLLERNGHLVIISPVIWDLHDYPHDYCRLNPDFYKQYALSNNLSIVDGTFLFSTRDSGEFFGDLETLPKDDHIYLNLIFQKNNYANI